LRFEPLEDRRMLAVITVDSLLDNFDPNSPATDGVITLREAILAANTNTAVGDAPAGSAGGDTIDFAASLTGGKIVLSGGELPITEALTIDATGLAAPLEINANQQSRVMNFTASTGDLSLAGLTLTGGRTTSNGSINGGGGIRFESNGTLALTDSTLSGNSTTGDAARGGGIFTFSGAVTLTNSTLSGNNTTGDLARGGGIFTFSGAVTLTNSTLSGNSTAGFLAFGGGIGTYSGAVTLTNSTLSGNSTAGFGAYGGGIYASSGAVTLTQSTLSGNSTAGNNSHGGGIFTYLFGAVTLTNSTLTGNFTTGANADGGGIFVFNSATNPPLTILNSIVAGNTVALGTGPDLLPDPESTLTVNYSLIGVADGLTFTGNVGNLTGTATSPLDPQLGPLADNGGPTQTHALILGSPAINAGDPAFIAPPAFDQRGAPFARVFGGTIDIGAFEFAPLAVVNNTSDVDDGDPFNGMTSLREAINLANSNPGPDAIEFDLALSGQTIPLGGSELRITDAIIIDASMLSNHVTINAGGQSRVLFIDDPGLSDESFDVTLTGITVTGGRTTANGQHGGAIWSAQFGTLTLYESIVTGNHTEGVGARGGGIRSSGDVVLNQSTVSNNSTQGDDAAGGGIHSSRAVILQESTVTGNSTAGSNAYGGGFVADFTSTITESIISENRTTGPNSNGGGFVFDGGTVTLIESTVSGNRTAGAGSLGGGVYATGPLKLVDSTVDGNYTMAASTHGGGIYSTFPLSISGSTISGNHTNGQTARAGAIFAKNGGVAISDSSITGNYTAGDFAQAGAIYTSLGTLDIERTTINGNRTEGLSSYGGAIWAVQSNVTISSSTVSGNTTAQAGSRGGAMWVSGELRLDQSTISGNSTAGSNADGGAIFTFSNIPVTIILSTITNNMATGQSGDGGAIFVSNLAQDLPLSVTGSILAGNTAAGSGNDLLPDPDSPLIANHSLIGTGMTPTSGGNNVSIDNPQLGPLADNGGPTLTHALLPGSPAIDAGDPDFDPDAFDPPLLYDQRGAPFVRVFDGDGAGGARIDIGAYEFIADDAVHALFGDYNQNGIADAADYTVWRDTLGQTGVTPYSRADGDGDGMITSGDYQVWKDHFGEVVPLPGAGSAALIASSTELSSENIAVESADAPAALPEVAAARRTATRVPPLPVTEFGGVARNREAAVIHSQRLLSPRAVDLLLAARDRYLPDDADGEFSLRASDDGDAADDERLLSAVDMALAIHDAVR
jgi:hypothetical protein